MVGHEQPEVANVGGIFGEDDVAGELAGREPEGEVGRLTELELGVDPGGKEPSWEQASHICPKAGDPDSMLGTGLGRGPGECGAGRRLGPLSTAHPQGLVHMLPSEALPDPPLSSHSLCVTGVIAPYPPLPCGPPPQPQPRAKRALRTLLLGASRHLPDPPRRKLRPRDPKTQGATWGRGALSPVQPGAPGPEREGRMGLLGHSPEHHGVVEVADGRHTGHGPLRGEAGLHEGPRVEHAQEPVDDNLGAAQRDRGSGGRWVRREVDSRGAGLAQAPPLPRADWVGCRVQGPGLPSPPCPWAVAGRSGCWTGSR